MSNKPAEEKIRDLRSRIFYLSDEMKTVWEAAETVKGFKVEMWWRELGEIRYALKDIESQMRNIPIGELPG